MGAMGGRGLNTYDQVGADGATDGADGVGGAVTAPPAPTAQVEVERAARTGPPPLATRAH